eukprot:UN08914
MNFDSFCYRKRYFSSFNFCIVICNIEYFRDKNNK